MTPLGVFVQTKKNMELPALPVHFNQSYGGQSWNAACLHALLLYTDNDNVDHICYDAQACSMRANERDCYWLVYSMCVQARLGRPVPIGLSGSAGRARVGPGLRRAGSELLEAPIRTDKARFGPATPIKGDFRPLWGHFHENYHNYIVLYIVFFALNTVKSFKFYC